MDRALFTHDLIAPAIYICNSFFISQITKGLR